MSRLCVTSYIWSHMPLDPLVGVSPPRPLASARRGVERSTGRGLTIARHAKCGGTASTAVPESTRRRTRQLVFMHFDLYYSLVCQFCFNSVSRSLDDAYGCHLQDFHRGTCASAGPSCINPHRIVFPLRQLWISLHHLQLVRCYFISSRKRCG